MKKVFPLSVVIIAFAITGCFSMPETNRSNKSIAAVSTLKPDDVVDKTFTGTDKDGTYSYQLLADGTLLYTLNGNSYNGKWSFDGARKMYPYNFDWTEDSKAQGYMIDFMKQGNDIIIMGYWTLTEAFIMLQRKVTIT